MERRLKRLRIGTGFLSCLLGKGPHAYMVTRDALPADATVVAMSYGESAWYFDVTLESKEFPPVADGCFIPVIEPMLTRNVDDDGPLSPYHPCPSPGGAP